MSVFRFVGIVAACFQNLFYHESRPKAVAVLDAGDERLDHLGLDEVAVELIELRQPEVVAVKVKTGLRRLIGIATQIAEVLHEDEGAVDLAPRELGVFGDLAHGGSAASG